MTDEQIKQANTMLEQLAGAPCSDCDGSGLGKYLYTTVREGLAGRVSEECEACNGSGLDPRTEMFRVTCQFGRENCDICEARQLTIAEAEAKGLAMLEWLFKKGHDEIFWDGWDVQDMPLLLAILAAVSAAVAKTAPTTTPMP